MHRWVEDGIELDVCRHGQSAWIEPQAFASFTGRPQDVAPMVDNAHVGAIERRCPRCESPLRMLRDAWNLSVWMDACPRGHGVYLDRNAYWRMVYARSNPTLFAGRIALSLRERFEYYRRPLEHRALSGRDWLYELLFDVPVKANHPALRKPVAMRGLLVSWAWLQVLGAALGVPGVAWEAHLGGFAIGVAVMLGARRVALR